jgi:hypothetical protein
MAAVSAASAAGAALAAAVAAARPGVAYQLGGSLYLNLTQRCNATPLHETRGPGFQMPAETGFHVAPCPSGDAVVYTLPLPPGAPEPSAAEAAGVLRTLCAAWRSDAPRPPAVVFAGAGEPLLALQVLLDTLRLAHSAPGVLPFVPRVTTNGLFVCARVVDIAACLHADASALFITLPQPPAVARQLRDAGVTRATVALASAEPRQYAALMRPQAGLGLDDVCAFVRALVEAGGACALSPCLSAQS